MGLWARGRSHRSWLDRVGAQAHERRRRREGGKRVLFLRHLRHSVEYSRIVLFLFLLWNQPKLWTELQAGIECLTQLLALLEAMVVASPSTGVGAGGDEGTELHEAAVLLQQQLVYNGQVLDAALDGLRVYKDGTQSLAFLRSSVHLTYALMRMLEKWAKTSGDGVYVRKRTKPKRKRGAKGGYLSVSIQSDFFFSLPIWG